MLIRFLATGLEVGYIPQHMRYDQLQKKYYLNPLTNPKMVALKCQGFETGCKNTGNVGSTNFYHLIIHRMLPTYLFA